MTMLAPDPARITACDALWRRKLAGSFAYIADVLAKRCEDHGGEDHSGGDRREAFAALNARLGEGPVSPWVTCLYSNLVAELTKADRPPVGWLVDALVEAAALPPWRDAVEPLGAPSAPPSWWAHFLRLLDTDRALPFRPIPATPGEAEAARAEIAAAMEIAERADPAFHDETRALLRLVVLGAPSDADPANDFGACSSFFLRETALVNAAKRRSPLAMLDTLVHESSHVLLFSIASEGPLTADRGEVRLKSAARPDPRPIDGIFHAAFVTTRVHLAMERLIASGRLSAEEAREAAARRDRNGEIAAGSLATLLAHAAPTPLGAEVLGALRSYWAGQGAAAVAGAA